jgi:hypothetical protein
MDDNALIRRRQVHSQQVVQRLGQWRYSCGDNSEKQPRKVRESYSVIYFESLVVLDILWFGV